MFVKIHGYQVKILRDELGYSTYTVAEISGLSQSYISRIETGFRDNVSLRTLARLAYALDVPEEYFLSNRKEVPNVKK